jgi:hypothetical protein
VSNGADGPIRITITPDGKIETAFASAQNNKKALAVVNPVGEWNRLQLSTTGTTFTVTVNGKEVKELAEVVSPRAGALTFQPASEMDFANIFVRESK